MFKKFLIVILSAALVMGLAACGTSASADASGDADNVSGDAGETAVSDEIVTVLSDAGRAAAADKTAATARVEWSLDDIAALSGIVTGITDREYEANDGAGYKIYEDIAYDRDIVYTVLLNTAAVRFDVPGEYEMIYWVYFDARRFPSGRTGTAWISISPPRTGLRCGCMRPSR